VVPPVGMAGQWALLALGAVTLLAVGWAIFEGYRTVPHRVLTACNELEQRVIAAEQIVGRFKAEYLERRAAQDAFEERVEELLASATSKQRRAAASLSRMEGKGAGSASGTPPSQSGALPDLSAVGEEAFLHALRQRAGIQ